jgi:two-component system response regulator HydG
VRSHTRSLSVIAAHLVALCGIGSILVDLALSLPDKTAGIGRSRRFRLVPYIIGAIFACAGLAALAPAAAPLRYAQLFPSWLVLVPPLFAGISVFFALIFRILPSRIVASPEQIAENSWAVQSLIPLAIVIAILGLLRLAGLVNLDHGLCRAAVALAAALTVAGHALLVDERYRRFSARFARAAAASVSALIPIALVVALFFPPLSSFEAPSVALAAAAIVLIYGLVLWALRPIIWRAIAPAGGRLLQAVEHAVERLAATASLEEIGHAVLLPLRESSGNAAVSPLLYTFNPQREVYLDAAGQPHVAERSISPTLGQYLRQKRGEVILRDPLEASIVRQPPFRPMVEALVAVDALCVLPLISGDELEGAIIIPKGARRAPLTLEELEALRRLGRHLVGPINIVSALARAQQRVSSLTVDHRMATEQVNALQAELSTLRFEASFLKAGRSTETLSKPQVAYSGSMRSVVARIEALASSASHALLVADIGNFLEPLAYLLHARGNRAEKPFVIADCVAVGAEACGRALFGYRDASGELPGWLQLAQGGSLLLLDLPALPIEVQRTLGWALATRQAQAIDGDVPFALDVRLIATSREPPEVLIAAGGLDAELGNRLEAGVVRIPPLRDRSEDLASLVLLELNRACRVLGREPVGIDAEALEVLQEHDWPGNLQELRLVIERAAAKTRAARVGPSDIPPLGSNGRGETSPPAEPMDATFDVLERRILEQAIANAGGNKSRAARMLGLKRTTFLDKLKRYRLEEDKSTPSDE